MHFTSKIYPLFYFWYWSLWFLFDFLCCAIIRILFTTYFSIFPLNLKFYLILLKNFLILSIGFNPIEVMNSSPLSLDKCYIWCLFRKSIFLLSINNKHFCWCRHEKFIYDPNKQSQKEELINKISFKRKTSVSGLAISHPVTLNVVE